MLIKQLVWERPNANVVIDVCNEDIHKWVLVTRDLDLVMVPLLPSPLPWIPFLQTGSRLMTQPRAHK